MEFQKHNWCALNLLDTKSVVPCFPAHCVEWRVVLGVRAKCRPLRGSGISVGKIFAQSAVIRRSDGYAIAPRCGVKLSISWALRSTGDDQYMHVYGRHVWEMRSLPGAKSWRWFLSSVVIRKRWLSKGRGGYCQRRLWNTLTNGEIDSLAVAQCL